MIGFCLKFKNLVLKKKKKKKKNDMDKNIVIISFFEKPKNLHTFQKSLFKEVLKNMKKIIFSASRHNVHLHLSNVNLHLPFLIHGYPSPLLP